jgi:hypothetical protein
VDILHKVFIIIIYTANISAGIVTRLWARLPRNQGMDARKGQDMLVFLFSITSRPALRPTQSHIHWAQGAVSPRMK